MKDREPTMENAAELLIEMYEQGGASAVYHCLSEDDVTRVMKHPMVMHGSDAGITEFGGRRCFIPGITATFPAYSGGTCANSACLRLRRR